MSLRIPTGGQVVENVVDFATIDKTANRNLGAVFDPQLFDAGAVDAVESPDETQHARQVAQTMTAARTEDAHESAPGAERARAFEPYDQRGTRQSDVEGCGGEIAVADPGL